MHLCRAYKIINDFMYDCLTMKGSSLKLVFVVPLMVLAICTASLKIEGSNRRQMLQHRHPEHCVPTMPLPPLSAAQEPAKPPLLSREKEGAPVAAPEIQVVVLLPGYKLTPFHVHACNTPCMGPNDCYWPCMACCPNSTCCDL